MQPPALRQDSFVLTPQNACLRWTDVCALFAVRPASSTQNAERAASNTAPQMQTFALLGLLGQICQRCTVSRQGTTSICKAAKLCDLHLWVAKVQGLIQKLIDQDKIAFDALLAELAAKVGFEESDHLHSHLHSVQHSAWPLGCAKTVQTYASLRSFLLLFLSYFLCTEREGSRRFLCPHTNTVRRTGLGKFGGP